MTAAEVAHDIRWTVEVSAEKDRWHDVGAPIAAIEAGGSLVFRGDDGGILVAYAPAAWISVACD